MIGIRCYGGSTDREKTLESAKKWAIRKPDEYVRVEEVETIWRNKEQPEFDSKAILRIKP
jgi:hypothetical protein